MYILPFQNFALSTTQGTYKTLAGIIVPATAVAGKIVVRRIVICPSDVAPLDSVLNARLIRGSTASSTPGTAVTAANMARRDPTAGDPICTGGIEYSAEPTSLETYPIWVAGGNDRGIIDERFFDPLELPSIAGSATAILALQATTRSSNATASKVTGFIEFDQNRNL